MLNYMLLTVVVNGHNCVAIRRTMLHPSTYDETVYVNAAVEINVLNYNVRRRMSTYGAVHSVNGVLLK